METCQAVFDVDRIDGTLTLRELMPGATLEEVRAKTDARFEVREDLMESPIWKLISSKEVQFLKAFEPRYISESLPTPMRWKACRNELARLFTRRHLIFRAYLGLEDKSGVIAFLWSTFEASTYPSILSLE